jgi:hypothetical protein
MYLHGDQASMSRLWGGLFWVGGSYMRGRLHQAECDCGRNPERKFWLYFHDEEVIHICPGCGRSGWVIMAGWEGPPKDAGAEAVEGEEPGAA